jgi:Acetyl esterase (deacetylase)
MPLFDLPLEQLKTYQGINPRPADFDQYWDDALQEMHTIDPQVELIPSSFKVPGAECFDLYFTGVRGARVHAKYLRPQNNPGPHPAVVQFHGYADSSGDWNDKLNYVALGFSIAVLDCRGQGGFSEDRGGVSGTTFHGHIIRGLDDPPDQLLFRQIFLDTAELAAIVMALPEVDAGRVGAMGGSQGGALALVCASLEPRVKKVASLYPFLCDYQRVWELDLAKDAYEEIRTYFRRWDPLHEKEYTIFTKLGYIDVQNLVGRIHGSVLMGVGLMDTTCPPSTQFAAFNKITTSKKLLVYPDYWHEWIPGFWDQTLLYMAEL